MAKTLKELKELKEEIHGSLVKLKDGLGDGETFNDDQLKQWDEFSGQLSSVDAEIATAERLLSFSSPEGEGGGRPAFTPAIHVAKPKADPAAALRGWALTQVNRANLLTDDMRTAQGQTQWDGPFHGNIRWDQEQGVDVTGGHSVNEAVVAGVVKKMKSFGGMMEACTVFTTSDGAPLKKVLRDSTNFKAQKTDELTATANTTQNMDKVTFGEMELTSGIYEISLKLIRDSAYDVLGDFQDAIGESFARGANGYLTTGTGTGEPNGLETAVTAITSAALNYATVLELYHSVDEAYRRSPKCAWMMSDATLKIFKQTMLDADGRPLYKRQGNIVDGFTYVIEDKPVKINNDLTTGKMFFGDMAKYQIRLVGGVSITVLNELFALRRAIGMVGHTSIDGQLVDNTAIKQIVLS